MTNAIRARIDQIRQGKVPEGYVRTRAGIMPSDWPTTIKARDVFYSHSVKSNGCGLMVLSATQDRGIVPRSEVDIDIKYDTNNLDSYKKVDVGDFVISLRSFQGGIECSTYEGIVSPAYTVLKNRIAICNGYYREYFKTDDFIARLNGAVYGIRDGKQIGFDDFGDMLIHCPSLQEQERIAKILSTCDRIIDKYEEETDQYRKLKQHLLGKMFPAEGAVVPEIRFPGFTDPWEQRKVGDTCRINGRIGFRGYTEKDIISKDAGGVLTFSPTNIVENKLTVNCKNTYITREKFEESPEIMIKNGDILFVKTGSTLGKSALVEGLEEDASINPQIVVMRVKEGTEAFFFNVLITHEILKQIAAVKIGGAVPTMTETELKNFVYYEPTTNEEKLKIGSYFQRIDNLITLHQRKCDALKNAKKFFLQNMFV